MDIKRARWQDVFSNSSAQHPNQSINPQHTQQRKFAAQSRATTLPYISLSNPKPYLHHTMPRQGYGHKRASKKLTSLPPQAGQDNTSAVDRSAKAAPAPEHEKGAALDDMPASAGTSQGLTQGGQGGRQQK
jgi:hypothetical protein